MSKARRIAASSRVCAAKRASELDETRNIQRNRASAEVISSASPVDRCASASVVPTSCSGSTPTRAPPRGGCGRASARGSVAARLAPRRGCGPRLGTRADRAGARRSRPRQRRRRTGAAARISAGHALGLLRRLGVELIGQHAAAALIGLDRHAALAARGIGAHQRPPCALVRAVDRQQLLRRGDHRVRVGLLAQQVLGQHAGAVAQPLALAGEPGVEGGIDAVQVLQQVAVQQRQRRRLVGRGAQHLLDVDPHRAGAQHQVVAVDRQDLRADRRHRLEQPVDFLAQRGARLLLRPAAPQQFGQPAAQHRPRRGQRQHRQQRPRLAAGRQHAFAGERPGFHLADQAQPHQHGIASAWTARSMRRRGVILAIMCALDAILRR